MRVMMYSSVEFHRQSPRASRRRSKERDGDRGENDDDQGSGEFMATKDRPAGNST